jgi:hypothetical protein
MLRKDECKTQLVSRLPKSLRAYVDDRTVLFLKIARPDKTKALRRDLLLLAEVDRLLAAGNRTALYLIVTRWTEDALTSPNKRIAPRHLFLAQLEECNRDLTHTHIALIEEFDFPASLGLSRSVALAAADVTLLLSSYESFGLSAWEAIPYGAVTVVSSALGSVAWLREQCPEALAAHPSVVVADYRETYNEQLRRNGVPPMCVERLVAERTACDLLAKLEQPADARIAAGRDLVLKAFSWEAAGERFAASVNALFSPVRFQVSGMAAGDR